MRDDARQFLDVAAQPGGGVAIRERVDARAQHRQRGAQLVRRAAQELALHLGGPLEPREGAVDPLHDRHQLGRQLAAGKPQVQRVRPDRRGDRRDLGDRPHAAPQDAAPAEQQKPEDRQQHADAAIGEFADDVVDQHIGRVLVLEHLDDPLAALRTGGERRADDLFLAEGELEKPDRPEAVRLIGAGPPRLGQGPDQRRIEPLRPLVEDAAVRVEDERGIAHARPRAAGRGHEAGGAVGPGREVGGDIAGGVVERALAQLLLGHLELDAERDQERRGAGDDGKDQVAAEAEGERGARRPHASPRSA